MNDARCLQVDHIDGTRNGAYSSKTRDAVLRGETEGLQILCANCHAIKTYENKDFLRKTA